MKDFFIFQEKEQKTEKKIWKHLTHNQINQIPRLVIKMQSKDVASEWRFVQ